MAVKSKKGITVRTFSGLNKKRIEKRGSANFGKRMRLDSGQTIPVQFLQAPDDMKEYDVHSFREDGRWTYVPCLGDDCPLCEDEDADRRKVSYRFVCNVYNLKEKKVQLLEGPKDLASRVSYRYERKSSAFLKRSFDITKLNTSPVTYDVAVGEDDIVKTTNLELLSLDDYIDEEAKRFYGDELPVGKSALDAEDDDDVDEDADDEDEDEADELREELEELTTAKLKARAKKNGATVAELKGLDDDELVDLIVEQETADEDDEEDEDDDTEDDEDSEDDDEDDDDEDDDDLEAIAAAARQAKKAGAKKAAAKKSARR